MSALAIMLLAAGQSKRFGSPKQLQPIRGIPMVRHVVDTLMGVPHERFIVVLGACREEISAILQSSGIDIIYNDQWDAGISTSIKMGLAEIAKRSVSIDHVLIALADQPYLTTADYQEIVDQSGSDLICAASYDGRAGVPACFPKSHWGLLNKLRGDAGAAGVMRGLSNVHVIELSDLRDVDKIDDLGTPDFR